MITKRIPERDDSMIIQLIRDELLPLTLRRFPDTSFNQAEINYRLSTGDTYIWKDRIGRITGFIHMYIKDGVAWIDMIAVNRRKQGKGIGHKLIHHAIQYGRAYRLRDLALYVDKSNSKAIRFYKKLGFRSIQYHPHIYCYEFSKNL